MHFQETVSTKLLVRASDQSIIDRQGILMQILLVAGLTIVLFTSKHKLYECSQVECWRTSVLADIRPKNRLVRIHVIALV